MQIAQGGKVGLSVNRPLRAMPAQETKTGGGSDLTYGLKNGTGDNLVPLSLRNTSEEFIL
jgi:hypothetical protein